MEGGERPGVEMEEEQAAGAAEGAWGCAGTAARRLPAPARQLLAVAWPARHGTWRHGKCRTYLWGRCMPGTAAPSRPLRLFGPLIPVPTLRMGNRSQAEGALVGSGVIPRGFVDSIALNLYHDGSEGIQVSRAGAGKEGSISLSCCKSGAVTRPTLEMKGSRQLAVM